MVTRIGSHRPVRLFLAEWRNYRALTQQQLADRVGTSKGTISRWEAGVREPPLGAIGALADALSIDPGDLFRDPQQPSADDLLRGATPAERDQAITVIKALRRVS